MKDTIVEQISCGNGYIPVRLPGQTRVINGKTEVCAPIVDIRSAIKEAINNPVGHEPITKLVGPKSKITIAFDDASGSYFQTKGDDPRKIAIEVLIQEFRELGVDLNNIKLLCAQGLHRKLSRTEMETFLGRKIVLQFGYNNLLCHDAEDPEQLTHLGYTERGFDVEVNRAIIDSDQFIYLNTMWAPFNGGWKSTAVGLGTFRSIRHHHRPWPIASGQSVDDPKNSSFKKLVWEQGNLIKKALEAKGKRLFTIETVYNNKDIRELVEINAGHPTEVHPITLQAIEQQQIVEVQGQSDIMIAGIANHTECYSKFSTINPILVANQGFANTIMQFQNMPVVRPQGIAILAHPLTPQFDSRPFRPYQEFYERLLNHSKDPYWLWENHVEDFAHRPEYIQGYRYGYSYHGSHPFFMWNSTGIARKYLSNIYFAGVKDREVATRLGFQAFASVEEALKAAQSELGKSDPSITLLKKPPHFIPRVSLT